jgi:uncharacterized protein YdhG (YjbR/CyaY superfamily)
MGMKGAPEAPATVEEYIARQDRKTQAVLKKLRALIRKTAPEAEERISYRMPAYHMKGVLVYFAAWEKHIGIYPGAAAVAAFEKELAGYVHAKGSIQFRLDRPFPYGFVKRILKERMGELAAKVAWKPAARRAKASRTKPKAKGRRP